MQMADKKYDDRALTEADKTALPKPQIQIIVDGKTIFKPGMKTYFVEDGASSSKDADEAKVMGTYCSCDTVVSTHLVCTCESVSTGCSCLKYSAVSPCSCVSHKVGGGGGTVCTCQSVSCGSPCACIPVRM